MTPIYASDRIDLSGWYAYNQPSGQLVVWDGGINRSEQGSTVGMWCPFSGNPIPVPANVLDKFPPMPLYGYWHSINQHMTVIDFPHPDSVLQLTGRQTNAAIMYLTTESGGPMPFFLSVLNAHSMQEHGAEDVCSFVRVRILPEDKDEALKIARSMGNDCYVRHPHSIWTRQRNPLFASIQKPFVFTSRVREVKIDEDGYVDEVTAWKNPQTLITFSPLYEGDQFPDTKAFVPKAKIRLYINEGIVLGYD